MKNGTMFGTLSNYEDREYKDNHRYITLEDLQEKRTYEVIDAFFVDLDDKLNLFDYYNYVGDIYENEFEDFKNSLLKVSIYGEVNEIKYHDQIMMLSTCNFFKENGRFILVTKRIE